MNAKTRDRRASILRSDGATDIECKTSINAELAT